MKITLTLPDGRTTDLREPYRGADCVESQESCPACWAPNMRVVGGATRSDDYGIDAPAVATCCGARVGALRVEIGTMFGATEDRRVLGGPWRVF